MADTARVLKQLDDQARICEALGSPFTGRVCRMLAARLDRTTAFGAAVLDWPGDPYGDNLALRSCGALHALARSGLESALANVYPPHEASDQALWAAIEGSLGRHDAYLTARLASAPQTNEVARSALILGAMLSLTQRTGLPLETYEIGASAGLNLGFDEYAYALGDAGRWGRLDAPLSIDCPWRGNTPPLDQPLRVVARHGCDLNPLDPADPAARERLLSYVWADQAPRLERVRAALALAAAEGRRVDRADAADWLEAQLSVPQPDGVARVVYHTIVWQYLPASVKTRIEALLTRVGAAATAERPLARFSFEQDEIAGSGRMDLTVWPGGDTRTLGRGDFHGRWAEWA